MPVNKVVKPIDTSKFSDTELMIYRLGVCDGKLELLNDVEKLLSMPNVYKAEDVVTSN